jgi:hypothetical protein
MVTLGDLPTASPDPPENPGDTPDDPNNGTSVSDPDTGDSPAVSNPDIGSDNGEPKPKTDIDCGWDTRTATAGVACVGDQTAADDDSRAEGYYAACENIDCATGSGGATLGDNDGIPTDACGHVGPGLNSAACQGGYEDSIERLNSGGGGGGGSSGGGGGSFGWTVGGGSSSGGHSSDKNSDSGYIAPGM